MKVCALALALLFTSFSLDAKTTKTPKSIAAKGYKTRKSSHRAKSRARSHKNSTRTTRHTAARAS